MKKLLIVGLGALVVMLFASMQVYSGSGCTATSGAKVEKASAGTTSAGTMMTATECSKLCGMTPEECAKLCGGKENCNITKMSIQGMTCVGCEQSVSAALEATPGVIKVVKIDHKEGVAFVCTDVQKCTGDDLTKVVTNKGYKAEIIPAVATTTTAPAGVSQGCAPSCAKTCGAAATSCTKGKTSCTGTKSAETKKAEGSN